MKHAYDHSSLEPVYVFETPVRLWHWINAIVVTVLAVTGYLIANPPPSIGGEASAHYLMGYIRFIHFAAGYLFAIGLLARLYWALVGNRYSRELFIPPMFRPGWWAGLMQSMRWYLLLAREPGKYVGHNALGLVAMWFYMLLSVFMAISGFALYGEGTGAGTWANGLFGWVLPLLGGSQGAHTWHHLGMWCVVIFVMAHLYAAVREDIMGRVSLISTIVGGWRYFKDSRP